MGRKALDNKTENYKKMDKKYSFSLISFILSLFFSKSLLFDLMHSQNVSTKKLASSEQKFISFLPLQKTQVFTVALAVPSDVRRLERY
jgi:hypothetical protein